MILVDTNIPLRIAQADHPHRQAALESLRVLALRDQEQFAIAGQSLYEMYVVFTRPIEANGFGKSPQEAMAELTAAKALFQFLPETLQAYATWERLVAEYAVRGKRAHDTRLVALMIEQHVPRLLSFNDGDFTAFGEILVMNPFDVLGLPRIA